MILGYAVRDDLDSWACDPNPDAKPCYGKCEQRYIWTGGDAKEKARTWIKAVRKCKLTAASKYWIVAIKSNKVTIDDVTGMQDRFKEMEEVFSTRKRSRHD